MNGRADCNTRDYIQPDLAHDLPHRRFAHLHPAGPRQFLFKHQFTDIAHFLHPVFNQMLQMKAANDPAGTNGDQQAGTKIERSGFPAHQAVEEHQSHLVDHRRRNEEGEGHAQGYPGLNKANKERHCRAGAERGDDAEQSGQHIADRLFPACQMSAGALLGEKSTDDANKKDHQRQ